MSQRQAKAIAYSRQSRCFESPTAASSWASEQELAGWVCTKIVLDPLGQVLGSGTPWVCHMRREIGPRVLPIVNAIAGRVLYTLGYGDDPVAA